MGNITLRVLSTSWWTTRKDIPLSHLLYNIDEPGCVMAINTNSLVWYSCTPRVIDLVITGEWR